MKKIPLFVVFTFLILISACTYGETDPILPEDTLQTQYTQQTEPSDIPTTEPDTTDPTQAPLVIEFMSDETTPNECDDTLSRTVILNASELIPDSGVWASGGNRVCFGQYDGVPLVFRILASPDTQSFADNKNGLFLDCDYIIEHKKFDEDFKRNTSQTKSTSQWSGSDIDIWLNSEAFYGNDSVFSGTEKEAILYTEMDDLVEPYTIGKWTYEDYGSADNIFLISALEANQLYLDNAARAKDGRSVLWWVRSSFGSAGNGVGSVHEDGHICNNSVFIYGIGISPALNIDLSKIQLATAIGTEKSADLSQESAKTVLNSSRKWKLTLLSTEFSIQLSDGEAVTRCSEDNQCHVTVPFTYSGDQVNQISVMITDKPRTDADAQVLYYGALQEASLEGNSDIGTFILPSEFEDQTCGKDYFVYIIAEEINGTYETDYASEFLQILIPEKS